VMGREGWLRLGRFDWAGAARYWFVDRHRSPALRERPVGPLRRALLVVTAPVDAVLFLLAIAQAAWRGRLAEMAQYLRGLVDGALDRPLPLRRLGLR